MINNIINMKLIIILPNNVEFNNQYDIYIKLCQLYNILKIKNINNT